MRDLRKANGLLHGTMATREGYVTVRSLRFSGLAHLTTPERKVTLCGKACTDVWWGLGGSFDLKHDCRSCATSARLPVPSTKQE